MTIPRLGIVLLFRVASRTKKGVFYDVVYMDGAWRCNCTGFGYRNYCAHVDDCRRWLESILPAEALPA